MQKQKYKNKEKKKEKKETVFCIVETKLKLSQVKSNSILEK